LFRNERVSEAERDGFILKNFGSQNFSYGPGTNPLTSGGGSWGTRHPGGNYWGGAYKPPSKRNKIPVKKPGLGSRGVFALKGGGGRRGVTGPDNVC